MKTRAKAAFSVLLVCLQLIFFLSLTGCWDSVELNRRAIVSGVAVDRGPNEAQKYVVSFQIIVADEISGENSRGVSPVSLYTGRGRTMFEALANASRQTARFLSLGHVRVLVISEAFAREGIKGIMDVLERESDMRLTSLFFISKGQPAIDCMSTMTVFGKIPSNDLVEKLETTSKQFGYSYKMEVDDVIRGIQTKGGGPLINGVYVSGASSKADSKKNLETIEPQAIIRIKGLAVFKDDQLKGWLEGEAAAGAALIRDKIKHLPVIIKMKDGSYVSCNVYQSQVHIKAELTDPEHPVFFVRITQQAAIKESSNDLELTDPQVLKDISVKLAEVTHQELEMAIVSTQKLKSDVLGFGEVLERSHPRGWKKIRDRWSRIYATSKIEIATEAVIRHTDMRTDSFQVNKPD
ncbi:Ger(x)C family spore germination protein [Paenibacillus albidus]|uniref:Ger(x)C family spore germination protein n=1 Tax=Paenibacillus albidus TaxID=2041023 RepID=UPI001BE9EB27|nr:Ger(x)C family spore germination protein [Paenibacillus albidus]MBT2292046.1 Ger(x)C family spore germination protein [Paenibacillus albidus]